MTQTNFEKLSLRGITILINIIFNIESNDIKYIRKRFEENATSFDETLSFLITIGLIAIDGQRLDRTTKFKMISWDLIANECLLNQYLVETLFTTNNEISLILQDFISKFSERSGRFIYTPSAIIRRQESGIRNFLIELGVIRFTDSDKQYYIVDEYLTIVFGNLAKGITTQAELNHHLSRQKEIGDAAEEKVILFEKKRLSNLDFLLKKIQHVSPINVSAGYDILSYELTSTESALIHRFIEVKAVSLIDFKFYWSRNEVEVAKLLSNHYYLYLLPVSHSNNFYLSGMKIISDPYKNIFLAKGTWEKSIELMSFSLF